MEECQPVLWSVANLVKDSLDASIGSDVPNLENLISTQTNQVMSVLINSQILYGSIVTVEIGQGT